MMSEILDLRHDQEYGLPLLGDVAILTSDVIKSSQVSFLVMSSLTWQSRDLK